MHQWEAAMDKTTDDDVNFVRLHPRLAGYLLETPKKGTPCGRVKMYKGFALLILSSAEGADKLAEESQPGTPKGRLGNDENFRVKRTAELIRKKDHDLGGMLNGQSLLPQTQEVCELYARIVLRHERDQDIQPIIAELEDWGVVGRGAPAKCI